MKKKYIKPRVKVVAIRTVNILCISGDEAKINNTGVDKEATQAKYGTSYFDGGW